MLKLFGTDGIRGKANQYPLTGEMAVRAGQAAALFFQTGQPGKKPNIVIGRDTRISGQMIESALISGICSMGADVVATGVLPTPGVAFITRHTAADAGIVVSASHNPFDDNGIKFFNAEGFKLSQQQETELEAMILDEQMPDRCREITHTGQKTEWAEAETLYADFLINSLMNRNSQPLQGVTIVVDCSHGATFRIAPRLFSELGARVLPLAASPDGFNINAQCGSQHPETLASKVVQAHADLGLAFDGDGDRLIAVDEMGCVLTGDQILAIFAAFFVNNNQLKNNAVVSTVMSNIGLGKSLASLGVRHIMAAVGDRFVMEEMVDCGAVLGGEDSGHIILLNHHTTGDGMLAALQLLAVMHSQQQPLSSLAGVMTVFPQMLVNVKVRHKPEIAGIPEINHAIESVEHALKDAGRVLVRYSGTQPVCRIMVEASSIQEAERHSQKLAEVIQTLLG